MLNRIYVGNINFDATNKDLINLFSKYGEIVELMVIPDKSLKNKNKGYGFVTFSENESAKKAVLELNGMLFMGRRLVVDYAKESKADKSGDVFSGTIYENT